MKKIVFGLVGLVMVACSSAPFVANKSNELFVGDWKITKVDDSAAMISKEEFLLTAMHEKYKEGYVFTFENGPNFILKTQDGVEVVKGQYGIGAEDKSVTLQLASDKTELAYDLEQKDAGYVLTITTPGELVNLEISK